MYSLRQYKVDELLFRKKIENPLIKSDMSMKKAVHQIQRQRKEN